MSDAPLLDRAVLEALLESVAGDRVFVADLVETYLADGPTQLSGIAAAVEAGDGAALVRPAHTLKSASFSVGAMRVGELSRALEQRARRQELDEVALDASGLETAWKATVDELRAWLAAPEAAG